MNNHSNEILGYCTYCKDEIYPTDKFKIDKGKIFHEECWEIKNSYYDPFYLDDE